VSKKQFLGIIVSLSLLGIVLSSLLIRAQHPIPVNPDFVTALWIAQSDGIRKIATADAGDLLHIDDLKHVKAVAVDDQRGMLWAYIKNTLWAYNFNGEPAFSIPLTPHGDHGNHPHVALSVNSNNGTVWLGVKKALFHLGTQGEWLSVHSLSEPVLTLSRDPTTACLWVGTQKAVYALNDAGGLCRVLDLGAHPDVQDLAIDPDSGDVWVALKKELQRTTPAER
jgi:ligand-binding sensor domain-containing protein